MSILSDALDDLEFTGKQLGIPASEIPAIEPVALWPGIVYLRQVTLLVAPGGTGKGLLIAGMAATVSRGAAWPGEPWPEGSPHRAHPPGSVILAAPEDDPNEDLAFRLMAAGADLTLVRNITYLPDGSRFTLPDNLPELRRAIAEANQAGPPVRLVALDPLMSMVSTGLSTARAARAIMDPLLDLARDTDTAIVISHHTTKDSRNVAGNKALTDAARVVWMISRDDRDLTGRARIMQPSKANRIPLDTKLRYRIAGSGTSVHVEFPEPAPSSGSRSMRLRLRRREQ